MTDKLSIQVLHEINRHRHGRLVSLSDGQTYIADEGPADGEPLVLVHGASVPHWSFDRVAPLLIEAGFRVIRFDLYGHGYSDRPRTEYSLSLFVRQVLEVIEAVGPAKRPHVIGYSMGAAIAAAAAAQNRAALDRLILAAPLLDFSESNRFSSVLKTPGIGEAMMHCAIVPALKRRRRRRYTMIGQPHLSQRFDDQVGRAGFASALLSMMRSEPLGANHGEHYQRLSTLNLAPLLLWGELDSIIPRQDIDRIRGLITSHHYQELPGVDHCLMLTHPEQVVDPVVNYLRPESGGS